MPITKEAYEASKGRIERLQKLVNALLDMRSFKLGGHHDLADKIAREAYYAENECHRNNDLKASAFSFPMNTVKP